MELRLAVEQVGEHLGPGLAEVLRHAVQQLGVADLVLDLGGQGQLPAQVRRAHDPVAFGQDAHELGVGVHLHELEHRGAVLVRHPVVGLHLAARSDVGVEGLGVAGLVRRAAVQWLDRIGPFHGRQRVLQDRYARRRALGWLELERGRQHLVEQHLGQ